MPATEIEERIARLEGRVDEHSKFFESLSVKLTLLEEKGDRNRELLEDRIDKFREELEKRIDGNREKIESVREELEKRIDSNREKIESVREELEKRIERLRGEMATNFRWIVGIQITTWITVLLAILLK